MDNKYLRLILAVSSLFLSTLFVQVYAIDSTRDGAPKYSLQKKVDRWEDQAKKLTKKWQGTLESGADAKEITQRNREKVCEAVQNRVGDRWQRYYEARMNRVQNLERGILALQKRVEFFKSKGLDTTKLESDITTLQDLIDDYKTKYDSFLTSLEEVKTLPCINYDSRFLSELKRAKGEWEAVRASGEIIKNFYTNQTKLELKTLLTQLAEQNLDNEEE